MKDNKLQILDLTDVCDRALGNRMQNIIGRAMRKCFPGEVFDKSQYVVKDDKNHLEVFYRGHRLLRVTRKDKMTYLFESPIFNND